MKYSTIEMKFNMNRAVNKLKSLTLGTKILLAIILLLVMVCLFRPSTYKDFYKMFNKELEAQETVSKKAYDSIQKVRDIEKAEALRLIEQKNLEIMTIENELLLEQQRNYRYEKELKAYRNSNFNERFRVFSNTYNPKDNDQQ